MADNALTALTALIRTGGRAVLGAGTGATDATPDARAYRLHVEEAKALGQAPMSPQEWVKMQRGS